MSEERAVARMLLRLAGPEQGHLYAFARAHPYEHFGAVGDQHSRLYWRRVVRWIERLEQTAERRRQAGYQYRMRKRITRARGTPIQVGQGGKRRGYNPTRDGQAVRKPS